MKSIGIIAILILFLATGCNVKSDKLVNDKQRKFAEMLDYMKMIDLKDADDLRYIKKGYNIHQLDSIRPYRKEEQHKRDSINDEYKRLVGIAN